MKTFKILTAAMAGCILTGCTCYNTHVPGRHIDHGPNPGGIDIFFCNLDYILFPPEQGYVVAPAPVVVEPAPAVVVAPPPPPPPVVVINNHHSHRPAPVVVVNKKHSHRPAPAVKPHKPAKKRPIKSTPARKPAPSPKPVVTKPASVSRRPAASTSSGSLGPRPSSGRPTTATSGSLGPRPSSGRP